MNIGTLIVACFIGTTFVLWPIMSKYLNMAGAWANIVVIFGTGLTALILSRYYIVTNHIPAPPIKAILILLCSAVMNGIAVYLYAQKTANPEIPTAIFVVVVSVFMVIAAAVLDFALNDTIPSLRQLAGFGCAIGAIVLLTGK